MCVHACAHVCACVVCVHVHVRVCACEYKSDYVRVIPFSVYTLHCLFRM